MSDGIRSLNAAMRRLWADHVIWTRQYIVAAVGGHPDADAAAARLLKNQEDIGNAVVPFYGEDAGAGLTDLLKQHIMIAVELIEAAKAGDQASSRKRTPPGTQTSGRSPPSSAGPIRIGRRTTSTTCSTSI